MNMPSTVESFMKVNDTKQPFNFFKSLDIANINQEVENLHPSTHEFWENEEIRKELMNYLKEFSRNKRAYDKQTMQQVDATTKEYLRGEYEEIEVGFVDGLFELYKLRENISKTKAEIMSEGFTSSYKQKYGTNLFTNNITFRSSMIEYIMLEKRLELERQKRIEGSLLIYEYLILQHAAMKCILEKKYDTLMNAIIYEKFIAKFMKRRYSQHALVALVRSAMVLANQEFHLAFIVSRNNWRKKIQVIVKNKTEAEKRKLKEMQKPTKEAIKEQVSEELDEQLPGQVSELVVKSALKKSSKNKRKRSTKKKSLSYQGTTEQTVQNLESAEEVSGLTETGEIEETERTSSLPTNVSHDRTSEADTRGVFTIGTRGSFQNRGRGRRPFVRHTGEQDPYDMSIAPMNIYENQVLPIGIHNLSESFRPNLATIQVLSLGTKFIPKWKFEKRNHVFKYFNDFI